MSGIIEGVKRDIRSVPVKARAAMSGVNAKRLLLRSLPYLFFWHLGDKASCCFRTTQGGLFLRLARAAGEYGRALMNPFPSMTISDIIFGAAFSLCVRLIVIYRTKNAKKYRHGVEYGSARWGNERDIRPYINPMFNENIILTRTERLTMESRPADPRYARNKNVLVIGGSGSGKTRFFVKPQLMQMHSSYVVTDPKGQILVECGKMLQRGVPRTDSDGKPVRDSRGRTVNEPYRIRVLNTIDFSRSNHYNPFAYIHSEKDILQLVNTIMANTDGEGKKQGEDFWTKAERLLYIAYIGYIYYEAPEDEQNFATLIDMIDLSETREEDEGFKNAIDLAFEDLEQEKPGHFAVRQYKKYKLAAGKTAKSILISCGARLAPFDIEELREITSYDELGLDRLGTERTALFVIISDTDDTFNFLVAIMYSQLFNLLCDIADNKYGGRLPIHVRCLLDEFSNIGKIPRFEKLIATIRSREISASIILQAKSQLKAIYRDSSDTIEGNVDTTLFLGGKERTTLKELSEALGKETIDMFNTSDTRGSSRSYGMNYQKTGKQLMSEDEIAVMDGGKCILQLRGVRPFFSDKYDITKHPRYRQLSDFDKRNAFDIGKHIKRACHAVVRDSDIVDEVFDAGEIEAEAAVDVDSEALTGAEPLESE